MSTRAVDAIVGEAESIARKWRADRTAPHWHLDTHSRCLDSNDLHGRVRLGGFLYTLTLRPGGSVRVSAGFDVDADGRLVWHNVIAEAGGSGEGE